MSTFEPERNDEAWHLLRKIFLLLLVVTASALGLVILSRRGSPVPPVLFNIMADASIGLLAGFSARFALQRRSPLIQGLASAAASLVGLALLGYLTGWKSGIGPFQAGTVSTHLFQSLPVRLPLGFSRSAMDIVDLVNAVIAVDVSWIALRVWRQRSRSTAAALSQAPSPAPIVRRPTPAPPPIVTPPAPVQIVPASPAPSPKPRIKRNRVGERAKVSKPAIRPMRAKTQRRGRVRAGSSAVHLAVHEEHRCPYCLEPVKRNDPRGSVECQVCHTLHHKDCWDITGSCQVPHLNT